MLVGCSHRSLTSIGRWTADDGEYGDEEFPGLHLVGWAVDLIQARRAAGYSQESLAEALGVDRSTVARWEAGDHQPLPYLRPKIARLLSVSREELTELLRLPPPVHGSDVVSTAGSDELRDHLLSPGRLLLPVVIDGHPTCSRST
jgi:transcriptional regulator with XRE-family HTH domain